MGQRFNIKGIGEALVKKVIGRDKTYEEQRRSLICGGCPSNVEEPIPFLRVSDEDKDISGRMCSDCSCEIPLLVLQNSKICKKWGNKGIAYE